MSKSKVRIGESIENISYSTTWVDSKTQSKVNLWYWGLWFYSLKYLEFADFGLSWPFPSDGNSSVMTIITSMIWGLFNDLINFALLGQAVFGHFHTFPEQRPVIWRSSGQLSGGAAASYLVNADNITNSALNWARAWAELGNKSSSTTWEDPKTIFEPYPDPKR